MSVPEKNVQSGLVGVGKMGSALLGLLIREGYRVQTFDISQAAQEQARSMGAVPVASAAETARGSAYVHIFLTTDEQVEDAIAGPAGIFTVAGPGTLILVHSTILPETIRRIAAKAPAGVTVTDAAVTSIPRVLAAGDAIFLAGGDPETVARMKAYLGPISKNLYHFGPTGSGDAAKIAKNLCNVVERVLLDEAASLAEASGLNVEQFLTMSEEAGSGVLAQWRRALQIKNGHAEPIRVSGLVDRDIHHAVALADAVGVHLPVAQAAAETANRWRKLWGRAS